MNITTLGEKLKITRKSLGLTQADVAGNDVTRNLISEIENNKVTLTKETSNVIYANIRKKINDVDEDLISWLIEDERSYLNKMAKRNLEKIKKSNSLMELDKQMLNVLADSRIDYIIKYDMYMALSDLANSGKRFYLIKALEIVLSYNDYDLLIKTTYTLIIHDYSEKLYEDVIIEADLIIDMYKKNDLLENELIKKVAFNRCLAYKKLNKFQECIDSLTYLGTLKGLTFKEYLDSQGLKANCYIEQGKFKDAEKIYLNILGESVKTENLKFSSIAYINLAIIKYKLKKMDSCEKYLTLAKELIIDYEDRALNSYYFTKLYIKTNDFEKACENFKVAINFLKMINHIEYEINIQVDMLEYCFKNNIQSSIIDDILINIEKELKQGRYENKNIINMFFLASDFFMQDKNYKSLQYFNIGINLIKLNGDKKKIIEI